MGLLPFITWPCAAPSTAGSEERKGCSDDMLSSGSRVRSWAALTQADISAVACCFLYVRLCSGLSSVHTFASLCLLRTVVFLPAFAVWHLSPSSSLTTSECSLVWSLVRLLLKLSVMPLPILFVFTESRPQQWALTGLSIMLGLVIDLRWASRDWGLRKQANGVPTRCTWNVSHTLQGRTIYRLFKEHWCIFRGDIGWDSTVCVDWVWCYIT